MLKMGWNKIRWLILVIWLWFPGVGVSAQTPLHIEGQIAYIGVDGNVWIVRGNSDNRIRITPDAYETIQYFNPKFSPDGRYLAYCKLVSAEAGSQQTLYLANTTDLQIFELPHNTSCRYDWLPDSEKLVFSPPVMMGVSVSELPQGSPEGIWSMEIMTGREETDGSSQGGDQGASSAPIDRSWGAVIRLFLWIVLFLAVVAAGSWLWQRVQKSKEGRSAPSQLSPHPDSLSPQQVQELLQEGKAAIRSKDTRSGMQKLQQVIRLAPDNAEAWLWLGWAAFQDNQVRTAQRCFLLAKKLGHAQAEKALQWLEAQKSKDAGHN